jgi:hypothetical protein
MRSVIHFIDFAPNDAQLKPICGSRDDLVAWTTVRQLVSCSACARLLRVSREQAAAPSPTTAAGERVSQLHR